MASEPVITLQGEPRIDEQLAASEAITPGHLVDVSSGAVIKHAGAAKTAAPVFALERDELGDEISDAYASGDRVKRGFFGVGDRVNALVASGETIVIGSPMESAGDGTLRVVDTDSATDDTQRRAIVGKAAEAVTTTALTRVAVDII